jgi:ABC-2 type transport system permease protein
MRAFAYHLGYEFKGSLRDKAQLFMNYLFPLLFFVLVGAFMTRLDPSFKGRLIPSMAVFAVMCSYLLSMPSGLVAARESGQLRGYRISGVPAWASLAAPALANAGHMALVTIFVAAFSASVFGAALPADLPRFALAWLAMTASFAGLGALIAVLSPSGRAATLLAQCVYLPSVILGGLMTPMGAFPPALERASLLLPARHAMRAFAGGTGSTASLFALCSGAVLSFLLAAYLFEWDGKNARPSSRKILALMAFLPYAATIFMCY